MTQPTALFLADVLEDAGKPADIAEKAAAELRRLHAQQGSEGERMTTLRTAAQQALEALKMMLDEYGEANCPACDHADAAIYALKEALVEDAMQKFTDVNQELEAALAEPQEPDIAQQVVSEQAEDEGLWFVAVTASEAYLQQALRRLHAAVEGEDDQDAD